MQSWRHSSPYRAVGIYIGGPDRACAQPNLSASWVRAQGAAGWHFIPTYVGPQASFGEINSPVSQGTNAAKDAVAQARLLGFGPRTPIYYDMEAYSSGWTSRVLRLESAWTKELHALGYSSGWYSSSLSGIKDLATHYSSAYTMPDLIFDALWNGSANTNDPALPGNEWSGHQRIHQYLGGVNQSYGGVTINIDEDYLDVQRSLAGGSPQASQATAQPDGTVDTFFRGKGNKLWHDWYLPRTGWHGPQSMGGSLASQPSAVTSGPGDLAVFYKGTNGRLWEAKYSPGSGWRRPKSLGMGVLGGKPVAVAQPNGVIDVFWRGSADKHVWHAIYSPGRGWSGPQDLGGHLASGPSPAVSDSGRVSVVWQGTDGKLWFEMHDSGSGWRRPVTLGAGKLGGGPAATGLADGGIQVFWRGLSQHSVWRLAYSRSAGWGDPHQLATGASSGPFPARTSASGVDVFWRGTNGKLWWTQGTGNRWARAAEVQMGVIGSAPFAAGQPSRVVDVFWKGSADRHLWHARHRDGTWAGPGNLHGEVS
jgi:hypothetical protein